MQTWHNRIASRDAVVGVIGQGYVGLPLALVFHEGGFRVLGFDVDPAKVASLSRGESFIQHIGSERVTAAIDSGKYAVTADFDRLRECDAIFICVPTPLGEHREPDNSYIHETARAIKSRLRRGQLVVLESTTYPGTTEQEVLPILNTRTIPKLVGGVNPSSTEVAAELYGACLERVIPVAHARVAESAKLLENIFRSVNIALVNELKMIFDRMGIDVWEVIRAAATKPFGFMPFFPGPGLGGHCIPLDPFYLSWKAAEHGAWARFIELAGEINSRMPRYVIEKVAFALNGDRKAINGSRVLVLGLAYKANVDDDRESPSYEILELLMEAGARIDYCDPWFPKTHRTRKHDLGLRSVPCDAATFSQYDALVVSTAPDVFRKAELYRGTKLVVDTRNLIAPLFPEGGGPRLVKA
jgi:UDP-N-acetyl-D-glucosamine dehydrogenase